jgi:hypothetical protein
MNNNNDNNNMASSKIATASDGTQYKDHVLRLGFDLGTGHISIDGQHVQGDRFCTPSTLQFHPAWGSTSIKQIAILRDDGKVIYGSEEVVAAVRKDPGLRDKVLERFKLTLHPEFVLLDEVQHVNLTLGVQRNRGAIQDLFTNFFWQLMHDVREYYKKYKKAGMDARYWDSIPLELQISVPAMWGDSARCVIRNAATHEGVARAEL